MLERRQRLSLIVNGWLAIYIACDSRPSTLLINDRDGTFTDYPTETGVVSNEHGFN